MKRIQVEKGNDKLKIDFDESLLKDLENIYGIDGENELKKILTDELNLNRKLKNDSKNKQ